MHERRDTRRNRHRKLLVATVLAALLALLGVDVATRQQVHRLQHQLAGVATLAGRVRTAQTLTSVHTRDDASAASSLTQLISTTSDQLDLTHLAITAVNRQVFFQGLDLGKLNACVGGLRQAYAHLASGHRSDAVAALTASAEVCLAVHGGGATGLTYPFDFPDPFVLRVGSTYFAYATNAAAGKIQIIRSSDLVHWAAVGDAVPHVASWATPGAVWAPSVLHRGSTYVLYYSAIKDGTGAQCISTAVASSPTGPFVDDSTAPLVCQLNVGGSIDPSPFVDATGTPYLYWHSIGANGEPPMIWAQQLGPDGRSFATPAPTPVLRASQRWESGLVEGPSMASMDGQLFLFYSGNAWATARYAVGAAACTGPLGPCHELPQNPILASGPGFAGPGGEAVFTDASGATWMAFHAWLPEEVGEPHSRMLYLRRLTVAHGVPTIGAAR